MSGNHQQDLKPSTSLLAREKHPSDQLTPPSAPRKSLPTASRVKFAELFKKVQAQQEVRDQKSLAMASRVKFAEAPRSMHKKEGKKVTFWDTGADNSDAIGGEAVSFAPIFDDSTSHQTTPVSQMRRRPPTPPATPKKKHTHLSRIQGPRQLLKVEEDMERRCAKRTLF